MIYKMEDFSTSRPPMQHIFANIAAFAKLAIVVDLNTVIDHCIAFFIDVVLTLAIMPQLYH